MDLSNNVTLYTQTFFIHVTMSMISPSPNETKHPPSFLNETKVASGNHLIFDCNLNFLIIFNSDRYLKEHNRYYLLCNL